MQELSEIFPPMNLSLVISVIGSFLIGYLASLLSGFHMPWLRKYVSGRYFRKLLKLGAGSIVVVYRHQNPAIERKLPPVALEDVMALRNVLSILSEMGIRKPKIRHPEAMEDSDYKGNIISIGGSVRNSLTKEILNEPVNGDCLDFISNDDDDGNIVFKRGENMIYTSPSYKMEDTDAPDAPLDDLAIILRRPNPKNESCSVIVLAGVRGIGTWGASDHLRKYASQLYRRIRKDPEGALSKGFLAVLDVKYEKFDIRKSRIKDITSVEENA
ncbi:MAG: hypothetical protein AB2591_19790 [Candidatus Thiodiazotropha sp.]